MNGYKKGEFVGWGKDRAVKPAHFFFYVSSWQQTEETSQTDHVLLQGHRSHVDLAKVLDKYVEQMSELGQRTSMSYKWK